jgi:hypothetical protein
VILVSTNIGLVGGMVTSPSEKCWNSSVGMMTFPNEWKNKIHVPNHQPDIYDI